MARREYYTFGEVVHGLRIYYQELQEVFKSMKDKIDINLKNPELYDTKIILDVPSKHDDDEPDKEYKEPRLAITNCRHPETLSIFEKIKDYRSYHNLTYPTKYTLQKYDNKYIFGKEYQEQSDIEWRDAEKFVIKDQEGFKEDLEKLKNTKWYTLKAGGGFITLSSLFSVDADGIKYSLDRDGKGQIYYRYRAETDKVEFHADKKYDALTPLLLIGDRIPRYIFNDELRAAIDQNTCEDYGRTELKDPIRTMDETFDIYDYPQRMLLIKSENEKRR